MGRQADVDVLEAALDVVAGGRSTVVQVSGEPGIGKSRLLTELRERAEARGHIVFTGRVADFERTLPFGPFVAALDDYLATLGDDELQVIGAEEVRDLAEVFPALARFVRERPTLQAERYRSYRAVRSLLEFLSRTRPLVLALDDLHWTDPASGELLAYLLRSPPRTPVLLALAFRPVPLAPPLATSLERLTTEGSLIRLEPAALTPAEADRLLGPDVPPAVRAELHRLSGGVPFYLEQLARVAWTGSGGVAPASSALPAVPPAVQAALTAELAAVAPAARRLLEAGAVVGDPFDLDLAADVAELTSLDALAALDELTMAEFLQPTEAPRRFRFRHPLLHRAVYDSIGAGWRLDAHARAATRLAGKGPIAVQALHLERSASVGDEGAIAVLTEAAVTAKEPRTAARWFGAALRLLPHDAETARRVELMHARADALSAAGELGECHEAQLEILALLPPGRARRRQVVSCACVEHLLGKLPEARQRLVEALEGVDDPVSAEAANLQIELCGNALLGSDPAQALPLASRALETAEALGNPLLIAAAKAMHLQARYFAENGAVPAADLADTAALIDALDDGEFARRPESAVWLGGVEFHLEHFADCLRHLQRVIDVSRATRQGHLLNASRIFQARAATALGRVADAGQLIETAVAAARLSANPRVPCRALAVESHVAHAAGDSAKALASGQESYELVPTLEPGELAALARLSFATTLLAEGKAEHARSVLLADGEDDDLSLVWPAPRCAFYELLTACDLALDNPGGAADWADRAAKTAAILPLALPASAAGRARALVLLAGGQAPEAATAALEAADRADGVGARLDAGRSRLLAGSALATAGRRAEAVDQLERAEQTLADCGAEGYRGEALRQLRRLGRRVQPRATAGTSLELSSRELEIVRLLADNRRNREIAAELYISEKTVETHLSHIFAKLGVSTRGAAARRFTELSQGR